VGDRWFVRQLRLELVKNLKDSDSPIIIIIIIIIIIFECQAQNTKG